MTRLLGVFAIAGLLSYAPAVRADSQLLFTGFPTQYTPGTSFSFEVQFGTSPPASLLSYSFVMNVSTSDPSQLLASVSKPSDLSTFVFTTSSSTLLGTNVLEPSDLTIDVSGQVLPSGGHPAQPVSIVAGQNDVLGVFTFTPSASLTGSITISLDPNQTTFTSSGENFSITVPQAQTAQQLTGPTSAVPTPASWMLMGIGMAAMAVRRTRCN